MVINCFPFCDVVGDATEFLGAFVVLHRIDEQLIPDHLPLLIDQRQFKLLLHPLRSADKQLKLPSIKLLGDHLLQQFKDGCSHDGLKTKLLIEYLHDVLVHRGHIEFLINGEHEQVAGRVEYRFQLGRLHERRTLVRPHLRNIQVDTAQANELSFWVGLNRAPTEHSQLRTILACEG